MTTARALLNKLVHLLTENVEFAGLPEVLVRAISDSRKLLADTASVKQAENSAYHTVVKLVKGIRPQTKGTELEHVVNTIATLNRAAHRSAELEKHLRAARIVLDPNAAPGQPGAREQLIYDIDKMCPPEFGFPSPKLLGTPVVPQPVRGSLDAALLDVARTCAYLEGLRSRDWLGYLPRTPEQKAAFVPHAWVLEAMRSVVERMRLGGDFHKLVVGATPLGQQQATLTSGASRLDGKVSFVAPYNVIRVTKTPNGFQLSYCKDSAWLVRVQQEGDEVVVKSNGELSLGTTDI